MRMVCERCWERNCVCSQPEREADLQKLLAAEGLPPNWFPGFKVEDWPPEWREQYYKEHPDAKK